MRQSLIVVILLAGCGGATQPAATDVHAEPRQATRHEAPGQPPVKQADWDLQSSGEGAALVMSGAEGRTELRLFCPAGTGSWLVNAPGFNPIGSEERFSMGHGANVATLVADPGGDPARGGVTGQGPIPEDLRGLLSAPVSASYGAQISGPHAAPSPELLAAFVDACLDGAPPTGGSIPGTPGEQPPGTVQSAEQPSTTVSVGACRTQDERLIPANTLRAVGTEPFWGARVEGRCVTYSHPEDQAGTRVWTRFSGTESDGIWTGALRGMPFVMRTRTQRCSDGMSDTRYPLTVTLAVGGEQRLGCAEAGSAHQVPRAAPRKP